ncbi:hypothetical protein CASFOL_037313 [Castilleja foliolosa]|uniref:Uncharacterized protein n=1 Tax=Castilleja foliolosa TaxID=1961234 RepID=A0ABD3BQ93_9LAMI
MRNLRERIVKLFPAHGYGSENEHFPSRAPATRAYTDTQDIARSTFAVKTISTRIAYMDIQDIARLTFIALRNEKVNGKLLTFAGPRAWITQEEIDNLLTRVFKWTNDVADRLAFSEVFSSDTVFSVPMTETYNLLGVEAIRV